MACTLSLWRCSSREGTLRALSRADFEKVLEQFTPPSRAAQARQRRANGGGAAAGDSGQEGSAEESMRLMAAALRQLLMADSS